MTAPSTSPATAKSTWASRTVVNTLLALVALYTLMPLSWLLVNATKNNGDLFGRPGFRLAEFNLFSNLADLFAYQDGIFGRWLANSMLYSVAGALASTLISLLAGYAFDKYAFRGKEKLYGLVLLGILVPHTVISLPMYLMASQTGLVNTYWAVLVPGLVNPFGVYLARVFAESYVPGETLEAARIDGAGELRTFRSVALPMLSPAFMTIFLFSFTGSWNNFFLPLVMLNDSALYPVGLGLFNWNATLAQEPQFYAFVITGSLLSIVPLAAAFVALQRYWRSGLTAGAVK
ncbi:carbohydrate ABC transporter permease [Streptomyces pristinaespiralis]|jgi:multiple sugar transport system permease protein|uniref:Binding protein dependent transporter n=2 Tax=Streptomyces pristinaespiralis TaxID=38300 RepID=B5HHY1_STRE2|nr:carbohydrate ABC transporter permease [Streptomyces pristinaespiralis]ALC23021.1 binding protein dependent transporter [Streptomyces pristinaespiralis]EDY66442.1 binding protein dependent transporter [Streptomyces pristinaespiralis ATCC 25486]QMU14450.1 carbohydrate ABC transporter permease [Streptomyces pristinaespiralis]